MYQPWLDEGFARPGARRTRADFEIAATCHVQIVSGAEEKAAVINGMKPIVSLYMGGMGAKDQNFHKQVFERMGYAELADEVQKLYLDGRKDEATALIPDELVDDMHIIGTAPEVKERAAQWEETGVTTLLLSCRTPKRSTRSRRCSHDLTDCRDTMRTGTHNGNLMVAALRRHHDKPVMYLGDTTLKGGEVADQMSRYVQAFEALGAGTGTAGALLALNRPEVLFILGAGPDPGLPAYVAAPARLGRRPRLRHQRRRDHDADHRPVLHRARARAAREVPGADQGAHHRPGARRARPHRHRPGGDRRDVRGASR